MSNVAATNATAAAAGAADAIPTPPPVSAISKRIIKEWKQMETDPPYGCTARPTSDDFMQGEAIIIGPTGTPYEGGVFKLSIRLPAEYPFRSPRIQFITPVWHPNVGTASGVICLDIISSVGWSPAQSIATALLSIQVLLGDPNPHDVQEPSVGSLMRSDRAAADLRARHFTQQHAMQHLQGGSSISDESQV